MRTSYTKEYLLKKLIEASKIFGDRISWRQLITLSGFPRRCVYDKYFGGFNKAKEIAGLVPNHCGTNKKRRVGPLKMRFTIFHRDNFTCQYCGRTPQDGAKLVIDHIMSKV